jgi:polysaccharide export outer membrane protein
MTKTVKWIVLAVAGLMAAPASVWGQQNNALSSTRTALAAAPARGTASSDQQPMPMQRNPRYKIQRDDVLNIYFALSPELNQMVTVQPDGYVTLQNTGSIYVQGMTIPDLVDAVKKAYVNILHNPIVDVDLKDFQKPYFVVLGQVSKPGQYDLRYDMTVTEAIAVAGGFAPTAKTQVFLYRRDGPMWVEAKELKLKDILHGKNVTEDVSMRPGDMIFVPEKTITNIRKYLPYYVGTSISPSPLAY